MDPLILEPEFFMDFFGKIHSGSIVIEQGRITQIGSEIHAPNGQYYRLKNQVVLPGFVNCHSHAFQRVLRGLVERKSLGTDDFFSWRKTMYHLAQKITPDDMGLIARLLYLEMLEAGFTHVGEFHYLHHNIGGKPFPDPLVMSKVLTKAAQEVGLNICLLICAYNRSDFDKALTTEQARFGQKKVGDFLALLMHGQNELKGINTSVGAAIHSVRAVPESWFLPIKELVQELRMPLHLHVSEQELDVVSCLKASGLSPVGLLHKYDLLSPKTTLVHATHLMDHDVEALVVGKPNICICPTTEKNLGDGVIPLSDIFNQNLNICLGTDQHVRMDPFEEARSLEEQERLRLKKRTILGAPGTYLHENLLPILHRNGMHSLYPTFTPQLYNQPANLIALELPPEYEWLGPKAAMDAIMLAHNPSKVSHVITNGHLAIKDGQPEYLEKQYLINQIKQFFKKI